ncbi:hypothetical protein P3T36_005245 [Kitasatospora sp. MAP12-15]|uniref:GNAT family N-acetyltransferase n=1 Tax=unclassified Kitasatospora TaxID=2633591 RepID=UPI00247419FC|nr:GNAT family N-acetyltransferase [Kitasatospora sp. MAP12-44]MDH6113592.1 hypothetical protein [Kitasatospora sp. MAP12-44]
MRLRSAGLITEIAQEWRESVRPDSLYSTPEWLECNESGRPNDIRYTVALTEPGGMVVHRTVAGGFPGGDPLYFLLRQELGHHPDAALLGQATDLRERLGPRILDGGYPMAVSALPGGYLPGLTGAIGDAGTAVFLDSLEATAKEWECPSTVMLHVPDGNSLPAALEERGYIGVVGVAQAVLRLHGNDFSDYLDTFDNRRRVRQARVLQERRAFAASGLTLRVAELGEFGAGHAALHSRQLRKYGHDVSDEWLVELIRRSAHYLGRWAHLLVAERDGSLEAFTLCYEYNGELHFKMSGFSEYAEQNFGYFNLAYYELVEQALSRQVGQLVYGPLSYEAKVGRGCALHPRTSYLRVPPAYRSDLAELARIVSHLNRSLFLRLEEEWGTRRQQVNHLTSQVP